MNLDWQKPLVVVLIFAVLPLIFRGSYFLRTFSLIIMFAVFAISLNIIFGHTEQLFLFVGALSGIGAYSSSLIAQGLNTVTWLTIPIGGLFAACLGWSVCNVTARREFTTIMIAILTLALQLAFMEFFVGARSITGGSTGFSPPRLEMGLLTKSIGISHDIAYYFVLVVFLFIVLIVYSLLRKSRMGLAFDAIRNDVISSQTIGIDVVKYKSMAGFIGSFIIGVTGSFYIYFEGYILPSMFSFQSVDTVVLIGLVLGGMRTMLGPIIGSGAIFFINTYLSGLGQWRLVVLGAFLIILFLYFRRGLVSTVKERIDLLRS